MVNLKTPTSTYDGVFATPETTPAIFYYESTKSTPDIHQTPHKGDHPPTVEGSCFPVRVRVLLGGILKLTRSV